MSPNPVWLQGVVLSPDCFIDIPNQAVVSKGQSVPLSRIQFRIINRLIQELGHPVRSDDLIRAAWGPEAFVGNDELYVYINRIRERIEDNPRRPNFLISIRGLGYLLRGMYV